MLAGPVVVHNESMPSGGTPLMPRVRAHWEALGKLSGARAKAFATSLQACCERRREQVTRILDQHGLLHDARDKGNTTLELWTDFLDRTQTFLEPTRWRIELSVSRPFSI